MLGSCFTDKIGIRLQQRGFDVMANPFGPFFNPVSIHNILHKQPSLMVEYDSKVHCLDLPSRYQAPVEQKELLMNQIADEYHKFTEFARNSSVAIITLGSVFIYNHVKTNKVVTNCHKLPAKEFCREILSLQDTTHYLHLVVDRLKELGVEKIIFTISPVRHLDEGLPGSFLGKAILRVAVENVVGENVLYFPAFEILNDDLRDYRFYASDLKHPSDVAVDYIFSKFEETYFNRQTKERADAAYKAWLRTQHRPILSQ